MFEFPYAAGAFMVDFLFDVYPDESLENIEEAVNIGLDQFMVQYGKTPNVYDKVEFDLFKQKVSVFLGFGSML